MTKQKAMEKHLLKLYKKATYTQVQRGLNWYINAQTIACNLASMYNIQPRQAAAAMAILSPRIPWEGAITATRAILENQPARGIQRNINKAVKAVAALEPAEYVSGDKVTAFYKNLCGDVNAVTINVHMLRACGHHRAGCSSKQYRTMADAVTSAARTSGITPRDFQAIVWLVQRESN